MKITPIENNGSVELKIEGRLDAMSSDSLYEAVCAEVAKGMREIKLDAGSLDYISSAGLRALLQSHKKLLSVKGTFTISKASPFVAQTISMSGFDSLIAIK